MDKSRVFLVVGHSNWGKSRTLRALTNGVLTKGLHPWITIDERQFFVRMMSNDDVPSSNPTSYPTLIHNLTPEQIPFVIMAYCPEKDSSSPLITALAKKYEIFAWVLEHKYDCKESIKESEIKALRKFGMVECYTPKHTEAEARATALVQFIRTSFVSTALDTNQSGVL